jgi:hypothetical protein
MTNETAAAREDADHWVAFDEEYSAEHPEPVWTGTHIECTMHDGQHKGVVMFDHGNGHYGVNWHDLQAQWLGEEGRATARAWADSGHGKAGDNVLCPASAFRVDLELEEGNIVWDEDEEPWDRPEAAFCDEYWVHEPHVYQALNHSTYRCPGMTDPDLEYITEMTEATCEHGLSEYLCAGPNHYPADR